MPSGRKRCFTLPANAIVGVSSQRHWQQQDNPTIQPPQLFVCLVCHFHALDASGLIQHLSDSMHCSSSGPFIPSIDMDADIDSNNNNIMLDEKSSGADVAGGYDSNGKEEVPDQLVPRARALSHMIDWSSSSEEEGDVNNDDEQQDSTKNNNKYEYYDEKDFPASPDDTAHVFLADLCRRIQAPLYAYDEILRWAQEAHLSGYQFPTNATTYRYLIYNLRKRLGLSHLSHGTATIQTCGGGTLDFPIFEFESLF
jgi:hypothetical protein